MDRHCLAVLTGLVILGGIQRIAEVVSFFVPFMVLLYFAGSVVIILGHMAELPAGLGLLFKQAMNGTAASGGFAGATLAQAIRFGVERGLFSNESGLGSAPIVAAAAKTNQPAKQALVSMTGTFLDTIIVCSLTGLVLSTTGVWNSGKTGVELTLQAFNAGLPGDWGQWIVTLGVVTFAFSTILGWCYYGEKCFEYLAGERFISVLQNGLGCFCLCRRGERIEICLGFFGSHERVDGHSQSHRTAGVESFHCPGNKEFEKGIREGTIHRFD